MSDPTFVSGKWLVLKDPDDIRFYKFDFTNDLTDSGTTAASAAAIVAGVAVAIAPAIFGSVVIVKLSGLDTTQNALNFCTIRLTCANGEQIDRTMWYVREDH
jgi:hypothetical protein